MFSQRKTVELMKKGSNLGEMIGPNFRTTGPNAEQLVRLPNDWSECRTIGPNSERLVRMLNDWFEFRTNDEFDVATALNVLT
jgi:hypothetical protein